MGALVKESRRVGASLASLVVLALTSCGVSDAPGPRFDNGQYVYETLPRYPGTVQVAGLSPLRAAGPPQTLLIPATVVYDSATYRVVGVAPRAFAGNDTLRLLRLPRTVVTIGRCAFAGCSGLEGVLLPDSVWHVGDSAFAQCDALTHVVMGANVRDLGRAAFAGCRNLRTVVVGDKVTVVRPYTFANCPALEHVLMPEGADINPAAFAGGTDPDVVDFHPTKNKL